MTEAKTMADLAKLQVLVVDDDAMVRFILIEYLRSFGFKKILEAKNGMEALKYIRNYSEPLDLIISDWQMPRMDGHVLLKAVRSDPTRCKVKFVIVTSQASQERFKINRAKLLSVDGYIIKPFHGDVFREKILQVLGITDPGGQAAS
jgi:two-component system chemotaxis response regulator CheY